MEKGEDIDIGIMNSEREKLIIVDTNSQIISFLGIIQLMSEILQGDTLNDFLSQMHKFDLQLTIRVLYEVTNGMLKEIAHTPDCEPLLGIFPVSEFFNKEQFIAKIDHETISPSHSFNRNYIAHPIKWNYDEPKALVLLPASSVHPENKYLLSLIIKILHFLVDFRTNTFDKSKSTSGDQEFVSFASHQLKVPLASLKSGMDILYKKKFGEMDWRYIKIVEIMTKEILNMQELIMRLLDLSRLQNQINAQEDHVNILKLIPNVINSLEKITQEKSIVIKLICGSALVEDFLSDTMLMKQILLNLLHNACKYSPLNGRVLIIIEFNLVESLLIMWIADEGPGIKEDNKAFVFNKYTSSYQVTSDIPSTGLGLAICKRIIGLMNGRIAIESPCHHIFETYGMQMKEGSEGTAFVVQIPIKVKET